MKKILNIIGVCILTAFSFYYTNKMVDLSKSKDPIMIEINNSKDKLSWRKRSKRGKDIYQWDANCC